MESIACHRPSARPSRGRRFLPLPAAAAMLLAGAFAAAATAQSLPPRDAQVRVSRLPIDLRPDEPRAEAEAGDIIAGEYVVVFGDGIAGPLLYAASGDADLAAEAVRRSEAPERGLAVRRDGSADLAAEAVRRSEAAGRGLAVRRDAIAKLAAGAVRRSEAADRGSAVQRDFSAELAAEAVRRSEAAERGLAMRRDGSAVLYRYDAAIVGFAARLTDGALAEIRRIPGVRIEPNRTIAPPREVAPDALDAPEALTAPVRPLAKLAAPPPPPSCASAPKGLDRIDRRLRPCDGVFQALAKGTGVHVYVIDTGVFAAHSEFDGRVYPNVGPGMGHNATKDGQGTKDCDGHGTGVASVIGGKTLGVAPAVMIHPVKVFPCVGKSSTADLIAGINWVAADRVTALAKVPVVVNVSFMALKGQKNTLPTLLNNAIENSITVGRIPYVIAAGNDQADACGVSPAMVGPAITVGNIKPENDRRMTDSNFGKCVDLFAPGGGIPTAGRAGQPNPTIRDGTSFAAPHVAGVAALYLEKYPGAPPAAVWAAILKAANNNDLPPGTPNWCGIGNLPPGSGSPNVLLHWGSGSLDGVLDAPRPANAPPPPSC